MISTKYIVDSLTDVSYQQAAGVVAKKLESFINNNDLVLISFSHTIHEVGNGKLVTLLVAYRKPNRDGSVV
ncbi:MAG: hypothetical protein ACXABY_06490 [Candidatus Thorarchaeota archaeon]|jgi:hypothetical protein